MERIVLDAFGMPITNAANGMAHPGAQRASVTQEEQPAARLGADIDQADLAVFQRCFSGPDVPAEPDCAD